jgi:hypothetical protein
MEILLDLLGGLAPHLWYCSYVVVIIFECVSSGTLGRETFRGRGTVDNVGTGRKPTFSGERGKFLRENKVQKTLRLDADILQHFQTLSIRKHIPYQTLINNTLRDAMENPGTGIDLKILKKEIHSAVKSALRKESL